MEREYKEESPLDQTVKSQAGDPAGRGFRLACSRREIPLVEDLLREEGCVLEEPPFDRFARIASRSAQQLGSTVAAFFGLIYIQDLTSMLPPLLLEPRRGGTVLDLCAAPGGKTGILSRLVGDSGAILANEPSQKRLAVLRRNLHLSGCFNTATTRHPGESFPDAGPFEAVLLDAPCSGWGTADKDPRVLRLWTPERTEPLISLQRSLLSRAFQLLAPGGRLLYSTCTTHLKENEEQVEWAARVLGAEVDKLPAVPGFELDESGIPGCLRIRGGPYGGQSFFLARLKKPAEAGREEVEGFREQERAGDAASWLAGLGLEAGSLPAGDVKSRKGELFFRPASLEGIMPEPESWRGIYLGREHKKGVRLSSRLRRLLPPPEDFPGLNLRDAENVRHLISGQSFPVSGSTGRMGLYWRDLPLGFLAVKNGRCLFAERV